MTRTNERKDDIDRHAKRVKYWEREYKKNAQREIWQRQRETMRFQIDEWTNQVNK